MPTIEEMNHLEAQLSLALGIASGMAMKLGLEGVDNLRILCDLDHAKKLARDHPDGLMAALRRKYGRPGMNGLPPEDPRSN